MRRFGLSLCIGLLAIPQLASAAIIPGTSLTGVIDQTINSHTANPGDRFTLRQVQSGSGRLTGGTVYGHVRNVIRAGQGRQAKVSLAYDTLVSAGGRRYRIQGKTTNLQVNTKNNALKEAGGALAGMLVGNYLGKVAGTNYGGIVGAGGGFLYAKNNRADITVPAGSSVTFTVEDSTGS